ncbi:MAG: sulfurtransferase [Alteromonadaceae bacterium]|nr:sulfurtransferase [Alteromonadaceae bacterium]|tara:strand:- start:580 stop:954 length:375 start_codon:yes stop_codon:yes gene_type:complete
MRWVIAALVTLALGSAHASDDSAGAAGVGPVGKRTLVVDVRTVEEFAEGHFPGAINIPHEDIVPGIHAHNVDKDQTVLLYCRSGNRSGQAEIRLQSSGFSGAKNVGGLKALLAATGRTAALPNH